MARVRQMASQESWCQKGEDPSGNRVSTENRAGAQPGQGSGECPAQLWGHCGGGTEGFGTASTHCHGSR